MATVGLDHRVDRYHVLANLHFLIRVGHRFESGAQSDDRFGVVAARSSITLAFGHDCVDEEGCVEFVGNCRLRVRDDRHFSVIKNFDCVVDIACPAADDVLDGDFVFVYCGPKRDAPSDDRWLGNVGHDNRIASLMEPVGDAAPEVTATPDDCKVVEHEPARVPPGRFVTVGANLGQNRECDG